MKKALNIAGWVVGVLLLFVLVGFTENELAKVPYQNLNINIDTEGGNFFVNQDEISRAFINRGYESGTVALQDINIKDLETFFDQYPSVKKSQVYTSIDGTVYIQILQRRPIARVYSNNGDSYYMDEEGWLMPLSASYTSRVPVVNGQINAPFNLYYSINFAEEDSINTDIPGQKRLHELFLMVSAINKSKLWDAQFNQLYFNTDGEMELIPRVGNHTILIGNAQSIEEKLNKLHLFYKEGLNKIGWNAYSTINLKYKDQVVCTKRTHYGIN